MALAIILASTADSQIDGFKYPSYQVVESFDTPYGRETLLTRDSSIVLMTDNNMEGVSTDLLTAENLLIPPFAYRPNAKRVLVFGRTELGIEQSADKLGGISITAVDPRRRLTSALDGSRLDAQVTRVADDPLAFALNSGGSEKYDIIILNPSDLGSFKNSRMITPGFLSAVKTLLEDKGVLYLPTNYDSDRYITTREVALLATIHGTLAAVFRQVEAWPGNMTLFFASDNAELSLSYDSIITHLSQLTYQPQFISDNYLIDRLSEFRTSRLNAAINYVSAVNSIDRPILVHHQTLYRSRLSNVDSRLTSIVLEKSWLYVAAPILILLLFSATVVRDGRRRCYGLFLYFTAGVVSLTLEMVSFYAYQSSAGSLYSELAALIGTFMFGLSAGAYITYKSAVKHADLSALTMLIVATVVFAVTFQRVPTSMQLPYCLLFLLTDALGAGSLFAAATRRYYESAPNRNRGSGYALDLVGSSIGAVLPTILLLPTIGLSWLLLSVVSLLAIAVIGCLLTLRQR
jgi:spermidine synthase